MALIPRWKRLKRRDWKDPFSWFEWFRYAKGPQPVFLYRPQGGRTGMVGFTSTRADTSTCARYRDANGVWQVVAANVLRDGHYHYDGTSNVVTILREGAGTNSALGACSFADATYWTSSVNFTIATATSCIAGQTAYKHTAVGAGRTRSQDIGTFVNGQTDCNSVILENVSAVTHRLLIFDGTAGATLCTAELTWATKAAAIVGGSGTCGAIDLGTGPNGGSLIRFWVAATGTASGTGAAGNIRRIYSVANIGDTLAAIVHHAQFEAAASSPSTPIVTVASAVTRAADIISASWPNVPQAMTGYVDCYSLQSGGSTHHTTVTVGNVAGQAPSINIRILATGAPCFFDHNNNSADVSSSPTGTAAYGDRVEQRPVLLSSGAVLAGASINRAAETIGATSATNTLAASWAAGSKLYIGALGDGTTYSANLAIRSIAFVLGPEQSMATMRRIARG